jgi:hypothetical protein
MAGDFMRQTRCLLWCLLVSLVMSTMLIAWVDGQFASAATSVKPQGTVTVACHSFSKERCLDTFGHGIPVLTALTSQKGSQYIDT